MTPPSARLIPVLAALGLAATAQAMPIYIEDPSETILTLEVEAGDSIENVKARIEEQNGLQPLFQMLTSSGVTLEDSRTLSDYNMQKESTLQLDLTPGNPVTGGDLVCVGGESFSIGLMDASGGGLDATLYSITGTLDLTAVTPASPVVLGIYSLGSVSYGAVSQFAPGLVQSWTVMDAGVSVTGFDPAKFTLDTSHFANAPGTANFSLAEGSIVLTWTPVPEPAHAALAAGALALGAVLVIRRRRPKG